MSADRRSPYVTLGLPSNATVADARREFARRSEHLRRGNARGVDAEELAWALAEIERHEAEPATRLDTYRIPIDTAALRPPVGSGILRPSPRPTSRQSGPTPEADREAVFDAARLDAARALLDRTASAAGRQLERLGGSPLPQFTVAEQPGRRRGLASIGLVAAACLAVLAIALIRPNLGGDDEVATTTTAAPVATTVPSTAAPETTAVERPPGIGDALSVDGVEIIPDAPLNGFGVVCLLIRLDGPPPLQFDRSKFALISGGDPVAVAGKVGTGRASLDEVPAGAGEAVREACFPVVDWNLRLTELVYVGSSATLTWVINDPSADS